MGRGRCGMLLVCFTGAAWSCGDDPCPEGSTRRASDGACVATVHDGGRDDDGGSRDAGGDREAGADAGCPEPFSLYVDEDDDGWGANIEPLVTCELLDGYVDRPGDCDDAEFGVNPDSPDTCNGLDDDCSGQADDPFPCVRDQEMSCTTECGSTGTAVCAADCSASACVPPAEACNYVDDDCNGLVDDDLQVRLGDPIQLTDNLTTSSIGLIEWTGDRYTIAYRDGADSADWQLYFTTLDADGGVLLAPVPFTEDGEVPQVVGLETTGDHLTVHYFHRDPTDELLWPVARTVDPMTGNLGEAHEIPLDAGHHCVSANAVGTDVGSLLTCLLRDISDPLGEAETVTIWAVDLDGMMISETDLGLSHPVRLAKDPDADEVLAISRSEQGGGEVIASRFDENGDLVLGPVEITDTGSEVTAAVVEHGHGSALLMAATDPSQHFAIFVDEALGVTESLPLELTGYVGFMGTSGTDYLLSINNQGTNYLTRISSGGISGEPLEVADIQSPPRIAWSGAEYGLLYQSRDDALADYEVFFQRYGCE